MSNPLRVVHLGKYYPPSPGGIEGHTQTLARAQAALGADVRVLVVNHATTDGRDATFDRFTARRRRETRRAGLASPASGGGRVIAKLDVARASSAPSAGSPAKPDVWHLHAPNVTMMLAVLACPAIRPLVITHHSDIIRQRLLKYLVRPIERAVYRRAARDPADQPGLHRGSEFCSIRCEGESLAARHRSRSRFASPRPARSRSSGICASGTARRSGCASAG